MDLRVIHKVTEAGLVRCALSDIKKGDQFTMIESTGEGVPRHARFGGGAYSVDHRFVALTDAYQIFKTWCIQIESENVDE